MDFDPITEMEDEYLGRKAEIKARRRGKASTFVSERERVQLKYSRRESRILERMQGHLNAMDEGIEKLIELLNQPFIFSTNVEAKNRCNSLVVDSSPKETLSVQEVEEIREPTIPSLVQEIVEIKREVAQKIPSKKGNLVASEGEVKNEFSNLLTLISTNPKLRLQVHWSIFRDRMPREFVQLEHLFLTEVQPQSALICGVPRAPTLVCKLYCFLVYLFSNFLNIFLINGAKSLFLSNLSIYASFGFCENFGQQDVNTHAFISPLGFEFTDFIWTNFEEKICSYPKYIVNIQITLYARFLGNKLFRFVHASKQSNPSTIFTTNYLFARCFGRNFSRNLWSNFYFNDASTNHGIQRLVFDPGSRSDCSENYVLFLVYMFLDIMDVKLNSLNYVEVFLEIQLNVIAFLEVQGNFVACELVCLMIASLYLTKMQLLLNSQPYELFRYVLLRTSYIHHYEISEFEVLLGKLKLNCDSIHEAFFEFWTQKNLVHSVLKAFHFLNPEKINLVSQFLNLFLGIALINLTDLSCVEITCHLFSDLNFPVKVENVLSIGMNLILLETLWDNTRLHCPWARQGNICLSGLLDDHMILKERQFVFDPGGNLPQVAEFLIDFTLITTVQDSRTNLFKERGIDTSKDPSPSSVDDLKLPSGPITRAKSKWLSKRMTLALDTLIMKLGMETNNPHNQETQLVNLLQAREPNIYPSAQCTHSNKGTHFEAIIFGLNIPNSLGQNETLLLGPK